MTERSEQFARLYAEDRFRDQLKFYERNRAEAERARDQAINAKWVLATLAGIAGAVGAAMPDWRSGLAIAAAFLAAAATALAAYQSLYAFPRLAKLYKDAENSLQALNTVETGFRPALSAEETRALVERIENVFLQENGQWGQLVQRATAEPPPSP